MKPRERLKLLIEFCRMDLNSLRPGDRLNLQHDLRSFLGIKLHNELTDDDYLSLYDKTVFVIMDAEIAIFADKELGWIGIPNREPASISDLQKLQIEVRDFLSKIVEEREYVAQQPKKNPGALFSKWLHTREKIGTALPRRKDWATDRIIHFFNSSYLFRSNIPLSVSIKAIPHKDGYVFAVTGEIRDIFLMILAQLAEVAAVHVSRCLNCKKFFFGDKRKLYCSRECVNIATVRNWREKHSKEEESKINHEKYKRRVLRKVQKGTSNSKAKIQVQRRKRVSKTK